ncbi:mitochondrial outer membrane protein porin 2 isoform X1 [Morus notabilis]|nr:mitochondrial outer membrane protein porin 2 isoform X1 [Morus notabilis]
MFDDSEISVRVAKARESPPPSARPEISLYYPEYQDSGTFVTNLKLWCLPHRNAAVTFFADMPKICRKYSMSASIGTPGIAFGMQGMLGLPFISGGHFTVWDAGIQVTKSACDASITLRLCCTKKGQIGYNKGHWLEASYVHYMDEAKKISAGVKMTLNLRTGRGRSTIGGSWVGEDDRTAVKARFDNRGILKALLRHDIHDNARLSISSEYDVGEASGPRFGLALVLKPKN